MDFVMPVPVIHTKVFIPYTKERMRLAKKHYEFRIYNEKACQKCDVYKEEQRPNDICVGGCPAYKGHFRMWGKKETAKGRYIVLPKGDLDKVQDNLKIDLSKAKDKRCTHKMNHDLKFTGELYEGQMIDGSKTYDQKTLMKEFLAKPNGFLQAPPRCGKTVLGVYASCKLKRRTVIFAHEDQLLKQFLDAFEKNTNLKELQEKIKKPIVKIIKNVKEINDDLDVALVTYQKFIRGEQGRKRIKKYLTGKFGFIIVDEAHLAAAPAFSMVLNNTDPKYVMAASATPNRKDGMEVIAHMVLGPVVTQAEDIGLLPQVDVISTGFKPKYEWTGMGAYTKATTWMAFNKKRNKMLVKNIFRDLRENPKNKVIVPVLRVKHATLLANLIKKQARFNNENKNENWGDDLVVAYYGKSQRDKVLKQIRDNPKCRVLIAMRQMCKLGLNIKPLTHMHLQFPMNNEADFYQLTKRVCTPLKGKPEPKLYMYVDDLSLSKGCFIASWWNGVIKLKYKVPAAVFEKAKIIMESRNKRQSWGRSRGANTKEVIKPTW